MTDAHRSSPLRRSSALALAPVLLWVVVLVLIPNAFLVVYSFWRAEEGTTIREVGLQNYDRILNSEVTLVLLRRTLTTALGAACLATAIAYPMAWFVVRRLGRRRMLAVMLVIVPLWVSYLVRVYAWKIILGERGVLNSTFEAVGIVDEPLDFLLYSRFAVFLTLTYVSIPFVFVTSFSALERIPSALFEAASDSGAKPWQVVRDVAWPLSRQGAAVGFSLAFLIAVGDYLTPALVGGLGGTMFGSIITSEFGLANNWPYGAALSVVLLSVVLLFLAALNRLARVEASLE